MDVKGLDCIILGGGIGGLTAAIALAQRGAHVRVFEQADAIREVGAGLQISPNGRVVLRSLGLEAAVQSMATEGQAVRLRDYSGTDVLRLDLAQGRHGTFLFAHRADLIAVLHAAAKAAGAEIVLGQKALSVMPGSVPVVQMLDGAAHRAGLILGADGLHSVARTALNGTTAPFFTQQVAWRAVVPDSGDTREVTVWMGPHRHIVSYPLRGGRLRNIVAVQERAAWVQESWSHEDDPANIRSVFVDFAPEIGDVLARIETVHLWGLFRHPVAKHWYSGGVGLLGDAAHPTLPFLAQGANMAFEDVGALLRALDETANLNDALEQYQTMRVDRVTRVVNAASRNARKYHLASPLVRWGAHTVLRTIGAVAPSLMLRQFDWLYGYDVTRD